MYNQSKSCCVTFFLRVYILVFVTLCMTEVLIVIAICTVFGQNINAIMGNWKYTVGYSCQDIFKLIVQEAR